MDFEKLKAEILAKDGADIPKRMSAAGMKRHRRTWGEEELANTPTSYYTEEAVLDPVKPISQDKIKLSVKQIDELDAAANLTLQFTTPDPISDATISFIKPIVAEILNQKETSIVELVSTNTSHIEKSDHKVTTKESQTGRSNSLFASMATQIQPESEPRVNNGLTSEVLESEPRVNDGLTGITSRVNELSHQFEIEKARGLTESLPEGKRRRTTEGEPRVNRRVNGIQSVKDAESVICMLSGLQRNLFVYVADICVDNWSHSSGPLTAHALREASNYASESPKRDVSKIKVTMHRLIHEKHLLTRGLGKKGNGAFTNYSLPDAVYEAYVFHKNRIEGLPRVNRKVNDDAPPRVNGELTGELTSTSSSSSFLDLKDFKETTTSAKFELTEDWLAVHFETLREIGFTATHVTQVAQRKKLTPDLLQTSIDAFAFDLKKNQKAKTITGSSPLNFFMGIVGKGNVYAPPANYETPEDEALRLYLEAQEAQAAKRQAMIQRVQDLQFNEWYSNLSTGDKVELRIKTNLPLAVNEGPMLRGAIRHNWEQEVWPMISATIPGLTNISREEVGKLIEKSLSEAKS